jgi:hypothetical protein
MCRLILICGAFLLLASRGIAQQPERTSPAKETTPGSSSENPSVATHLLRSFRTVRIETGTWLAKPEMCEGALQKHREFDAWELSIVRAARADVVVKIDHQPGWFYYQYSMVDTAKQVVLASGNVTAWDGKNACDKVADAVIERIKRARAAPKSEAKDQKEKK